MTRRGIINTLHGILLFCCHTQEEEEEAIDNNIPQLLSTQVYISLANCGSLSIVAIVAEI